VFPRVSVEELRRSLGGPLPDEPTDPQEVIDHLVAAAEPGIVAMPSGRYFGFVIGGGLPAALAADWLTSAWDQNAGLYVGGPSAAVVEDVVRDWVCDLLGLPAHSSIGLVTGTQMGSVTALAAARFRVLQRAGWDVASDGLAGGPRIACWSATSATSRSIGHYACSASARRRSSRQIRKDGWTRKRSAGRSQPATRRRSSAPRPAR
jgi:glutamate/tyrosine decarboxylase-like PLP-dependent enzyme